VNDAYGVGPRSEDADELVWARKSLIKHGSEALPCLLEIYRHGPGGTGLWPGPGAAPTEGKWARDLIRTIDTPTAVPLYRDWYTATSDSVMKAAIAAELAILGEDRYLAEAVAILSLPVPAEQSRKSDLTWAQERAMEAVSVRNHKSALPALRVLERTHAHPHLVRVYIAQLSGDTDALTAATRDPFALTALLALHRMGEDNLIKAIATDSRHPAKDVAALVLRGEVDP
jgi:hypothetical protein